MQMLLKYYEIKPDSDIWTPVMDIVTHLETLGLRGNQFTSLKEISNFMKSQHVRKGRPRVGKARPVAFKGVVKK